MSDLANEMKDLNEEKVYALVDELIGKGTSAEEIIQQCNEGLVTVGDLFASGQYFLTELMFSAEIMQGVMNKIEHLIASEQAENSVADIKTVIIGTVKGDIHDIGKNIVVSLLRSHGFKVVDLGVDVPTEKFVEALRDTGGKVIGLSALLNTTFGEMKKVVDAIAEAGLRDQVKVIIGGTICSETVREYTGADLYANDAVTGVNFCKQIYS